ncbi:hypothetical protein pb186bvf_004866 [Paramecium bursaria]
MYQPLNQESSSSDEEPSINELIDQGQTSAQRLEQYKKILRPILFSLAYFVISEKLLQLFDRKNLFSI